MAKLTKEEIIEAIKEMSILEVKELVKACEEEFGVSAAAVAVAAAPAAGGDQRAAAQEKSEYEVVLKSAGASKMKVIKVVKDLTGLGLKEAKELVDNAPKTIKENVAKAEADDMKAKLEEVGAEIELK